MRLFIGISIPDNIIVTFGQLLADLRPTARIAWTRPENLHITTKFIGEFPESRLAELNSTISQIPSPGSIPITFPGLGWFPNPHSPRTLWAGVHAPDSLANLARVTDEALQTLGILPETKPYKAHLTLARVKRPDPLIALKRAIAELPSVNFGGFVATEHCLFQSEAGPSGSKYSILSRFPLQLPTSNND
jgi:2'-5' RNA ligase